MRLAGHVARVLVSTPFLLVLLVVELAVPAAALVTAPLTLLAGTDLVWRILATRPELGVTPVRTEP
jgi:hypothetical protein